MTDYSLRRKVIKKIFRNEWRGAPKSGCYHGLFGTLILYCFYRAHFHLGRLLQRIYVGTLARRRTPAITR